ncbi:MAG: betaine/proline/choline family ABC transporter ATP-binding protein [Candidatus Atribacteria bacterium]|nr:betaine/proline/choline family ABC transporter ATP-binding protein [Candidatus Atribacteria bacterium]
MAIVSFREVSKIYQGDTPAVNQVSLDVEEGEFLCLIGPSGCGKTTLLKMVNRLIEPTSGTIVVEGREVRKWDPIRLRRHIGYVIQQIGLFPHLTVEENMTYVLSIMGRPLSERRRKARELLEVVSLDASYLRRFPRELSGGERQRVGVARALASDPKIILMDEPFGALDQITKEQLQGELLRLHRSLRKTIVFVTHDLQEAMKLGTRIGVMRKGRMLQIGTPSELLFTPADPFVEEFLGTGGLLQTFRMFTAQEVMLRDLPVVVVGQSEGKDRAIQYSRDLGWDFFLLVDKEGRFVGAERVDGGSLPYSTVFPSTSFEEVLRRMFLASTSWVAVVDPSNGVLQGVVDFRFVCAHLQGYCLEKTSGKKL